MCRVMEEMRNETAELRSVEIAQQMIQDGKLSLEEIARYSMLAIERVKELANPKVTQ